MAIDLAAVRELHDDLQREHMQRHEDFRRLRNFWHGRYWDEVDTQAHGIASLFRDLRGKDSDVGPDMKIVHNVIKEVIDKYQTYLSPLPQINVYVDPPESEKRRAAATRKERFLYGVWSENIMTQVMGKLSWYVPLMGDCFLGIWPDFDAHIPRVIVRSPENAYPFSGLDGGMKGVIFSWKVRESQVKIDYPNYRRRNEKMQGRFRRGQDSNPEIELLEYSDGREFARWADDQKLNGVEHNLGFNLFDQVQFIHVPDEPWGHGAVEQYVQLNMAGNVLKSLLVEAAFQTVFPELLLVNPMKFGEQLERGAGAVIGVNEGGDAKYLSPPVQGIMANSQFAGMLDHDIRVGAGQPEVNFGQAPTSSIATGKAINELQGASTGAMVEHVQGLGIGLALTKFNEKAVVMTQTMFRDDKISLYGMRPETIADINPQRFAWNGKGSDIVGSPRNEVIFSPHLSMHEKVVMGLQMAGGGLVSKEWQRRQVGIHDNEAMVEEMLAEALEDGVLTAILQNFQQDQTPEGADQAQTQANSFLMGTPTPHPLVAQTGGPGALPTGAPGPPGPPSGGMPPNGMVGPISPGSPGEAKSPPLRLPPGSPPPGPPQAQSAPSGTVSLNDVAAAAQQAQGVQGRVFLVGEIVATGQTSGDIEIALTEDDRQAVATALSQWAPRLVFHHVSGEPQEAHVEVTPGKVPSQGGPSAEPVGSQ